MDNEDIIMSQPEQMRHELLIRVDEQMKAVARDVQEIKNGYGQHLALLDANKLDKADYVRMSADGTIAIGELRKDVDSLKGWRWYTAGGLLVLSLVLLPILGWALIQITNIDGKVEQSVSAGLIQALAQYEEIRIENR